MLVAQDGAQICISKLSPWCTLVCIIIKFYVYHYIFLSHSIRTHVDYARWSADLCLSALLSRCRLVEYGGHGRGFKV
jgi:hypothetical protein